jgi:hypothetical protein
LRLRLCLTVDDRVGNQAVLGVFPHQLIYRNGLGLIVNANVDWHVAAQCFEAQSASEAQASLQIFVRQLIEVDPSHLLEPLPGYIPLSAVR